MQLSIARDALLKPLQTVNGAVEHRSSLPILANVLLQVTGTTLTITGTDMEMELVAQVELSEPHEDWATTVNAKKLLDLIKVLPSGADLKLSQDGDRVVLSAGRSRYVLSTLPAGDYPNIEPDSGVASIALTQRALKSLIDSTLISAAVQDVRYYLNGIFFDVTDGMIRLVATDGHRLSQCDAKLEIGGQTPATFILPRKGVIELLRILSAKNDAVELIVAPNHLTVRMAGLTFTSKLIDGKFPDYKRVIPAKTNVEVVMDRDELKQTLSRAAILANEKFKIVTLGFDKGNLRLSARNTESEESEEHLAIDFAGDSFNISFNVTYLLDILGVLKGNQVVFRCNGSDGAAKLQDPSKTDALHIVMPARP